MKIAGAEWKSLPDKKHYEQQAEASKQEFEGAMQEYIRQGGDPNVSILLLITFNS